MAICLSLCISVNMPSILFADYLAPSSTIQDKETIDDFTSRILQVKLTEDKPIDIVNGRSLLKRGTAAAVLFMVFAVPLMAVAGDWTISGAVDQIFNWKLLAVVAIGALAFLGKDIVRRVFAWISNEFKKMHIKTDETVWDIGIHSVAEAARISLYPNDDTILKWHVRRVSTLAVMVASRFNFTSDQIRALKMAGLTHDVWKRIDEVQNIIKRPGKLSSEDSAKLKTYENKSVGIIESNSQLIKTTPEEMWLVKYHKMPWKMLADEDVDVGTLKSMFFLTTLLYVVNKIDTASDKSHPYRDLIAVPEMQQYIDSVIKDVFSKTEKFLDSDTSKIEGRKKFAENLKNEYKSFLNKLTPAIYGVFKKREELIDKETSGMNVKEKVEHIVRMNSRMDRFIAQTPEMMLDRLNMDKENLNYIESVMDQLTDKDIGEAPLVKIYNNKYIATESIEELTQAGLISRFVGKGGQKIYIDKTDSSKLLLNDDFETVLFGDDAGKSKRAFCKRATCAELEKKGLYVYWLDRNGEMILIETAFFDEAASIKGGYRDVPLTLASDTHKVRILVSDIDDLERRNKLCRGFDKEGVIVYWPYDIAMDSISNDNFIRIYERKASGEVAVRIMIVKKEDISVLLDKDIFVPVNTGHNKFVYLYKNMTELLASEGEIIPVSGLEESDIEIGYVSKEYFNQLKSEDKIKSVVERILTDPDTGEASPGAGYVYNDVIPSLLEKNLIAKAYITPKTFKYVSKSVIGELLDIGWARYAVMSKKDRASFKGNTILVYRDGLKDVNLRNGMRTYVVSSLIKKFDDPEAKESIQAAFEIANAQYGNKEKKDGGFLIDDALNLAIIVTEPVDVKVGHEVTVAALLFAIDRNKVKTRKIKKIPDIVWRWIKTFQELNSLEFMPPLRKRIKVKEIYMQNFKNYLTKYVGDTVEPLLLLMAYRINQFLSAREEMGADFYNRYNLLINIYSILSEQLGLTHFSNTMKNLSWRNVHKKQYRAILRQINITFGVHYKDLSVFADIFNAQIKNEIKELEVKLDKKIDAEVTFCVKDPSSIDEKIKYYAEDRGRSYKNSLEGIADLQDLLRGTIVVKNEEDLILLRKLPFLQRISPGEKFYSTAVARKVSGNLPALQDLIDEKIMQQVIGEYKSPSIVKSALERFAQARLAGKKLPVELQMQTPDMHRKGFTGTMLHAFYKLRKLGYDLDAANVVYDSTTDLKTRILRINSEPQIANSEFVRFRYKKKMKQGKYIIIEFIHGVPKNVSDKNDTRPKIIDILTRRDIRIFKNYILKPSRILINGKLITNFSEKLVTGDVVEIQEGEPSFALQRQLNKIIPYIESGKGTKKMAYKSLPATNLQSRVAVMVLLEGVSDEGLEEIYQSKLDQLRHRITAESYSQVMLTDDEIASSLKFYNMMNWGFRRANLLQECCLAMHFGLLDIDEVANIVFSGRGWKILHDDDIEIIPDNMEAIFRAANELRWDSAELKSLDDRIALYVLLGSEKIKIIDIIENLESSGKERISKAGLELHEIDVKETIKPLIIPKLSMYAKYKIDDPDRIAAIEVGKDSGFLLKLKEIIRKRGSSILKDHNISANNPVFLDALSSLLLHGKTEMTKDEIAKKIQLDLGCKKLSIDKVIRKCTAHGREIMSTEKAIDFGNADVFEGLKPLGIFSKDMPEKEMAKKVAIEIGKGNVSVEEILKLLTKPAELPRVITPVPISKILTGNAA